MCRSGLLIFGLVLLGVLEVSRLVAEEAVPRQWIGYTELRTNLPGGRHANVRTMRAKMVQLDGSDRRTLGDELLTEPDAWTQFAGWSPDGKLAILGRAWQSPDNARWEEEHKTFRFTQELAGRLVSV